MVSQRLDIPVVSPPVAEATEFTDAAEAVARLKELHSEATDFLRERLKHAIRNGGVNERYRAHYPEVRIRSATYAKVDSRLSFGHVAQPGEYSTTVTRPRLFERYLNLQFRLLMENHGVPVTVGTSDTPIPIHFAVDDDATTQFPNGDFEHSLRDMFDVPDLATLHDDIANGEHYLNPDGSRPLSLFPAQRVDYSLARLRHYTATSAEHFQKFVLFTNYQFYIDEFRKYARSALSDPDSGYSSMVVPGDVEVSAPDGSMQAPERRPQMPAYHLKRPKGDGISLVNIGIGPSNAKTATDHIAVLRPRAWLMVGHCAGLRNGQSLGDYVLAHAYLREDQVLDDDLPVWVPIPALAEVQIALERAVAEITAHSGFELKRIMRTGTVATVDNRNWELRANAGPVHRLNQSRAIALDMESATIAANGFRFRVPYGTLLCVSDKPLHGDLKLPGMANRFYRSQVENHLLIGIRALELLRSEPLEFLHSRKLRSFDETAFL